MVMQVINPTVATVACKCGAVTGKVRVECIEPDPKKFMFGSVWELQGAFFMGKSNSPKCFVCKQFVLTRD